MSLVRIIALDYGSAHTGAAICDPTGTVVRPLEAIDTAGEEEGLRKIVEICGSEVVAAVVVGMPVSLSGELGAQAKETEIFISRLKELLAVPVIEWDERFTSRLAESKGRNSSSSKHSLAACVLLEDFLGSDEYRLLAGGSSG